jgi:hypothetical protein
MISTQKGVIERVVPNRVLAILTYLENGLIG